MTRSERWQKEIEARLAELRETGVQSDDEFDAMFGSRIEQTMSEYRLMATELIFVRRVLLRFLRLFWALSAAMVVILSLITFFAYQGSYAQDSNDRIRNIERLADRNACITARSNGRPDPPGVVCP